MDKNTHAREAQIRAISIYAKRPEQAQIVNRGSAEVREGLHCHMSRMGIAFLSTCQWRSAVAKQGLRRVILDVQQFAGALQSASR